MYDSAVLATVFLDERLGRDGILGCGLSLIGSIIIILHAPTEQPLNSIDEMAKYAMSAGKSSPTRSLVMIRV